MTAIPPRKRGRPPYTRREQIEHHAHRVMLLWVAVRHLQAEYHVAGVTSPRRRALEQVAADYNMSVDTLRNLLKRGLRAAPTDVRTLLERELADDRDYRVTYRVYAERKRLDAGLAAAKKRQETGR